MWECSTARILGGKAPGMFSAAAVAGGLPTYRFRRLLLCPILLNAFLVSLWLRYIFNVPSTGSLSSIGLGQSIVIMVWVFPSRFIQKNQERFL